MQKYTATPWPDRSSLLELRSLLFGSTQAPATPATKRLALQRVDAYKLRRANLPHQVEDTAVLVDALLAAGDGGSENEEDGQDDVEPESVNPDSGSTSGDMVQPDYEALRALCLQAATKRQAKHAIAQKEDDMARLEDDAVSEPSPQSPTDGGAGQNIAQKGDDMAELDHEPSNLPFLQIREEGRAGPKIAQQGTDTARLQDQVSEPRLLRSATKRKRALSPELPPSPELSATKRRKSNPHMGLPFTASSALSYAFAHFVASHCDHPTDDRRHPMGETARKIGMPPEFVSWRHKIVHRESVSTGRLIQMCKLGLAWLQSHYWERLEEKGENPGSETRVVDEVKHGMGKAEAKKLRARVDEFKTNRMAEILGRRGKGIAAMILGGKEVACPLTTAALGVMKATSEVAKPAVAACLAEALVNEKMMIPRKHKMEDDMMMAAFAIWDGFVKVMLKMFPPLLDELLRKLVEGLRSEEEGYGVACREWIVHMLTDETFIVKDVIDDKDEIKTRLLEMLTPMAGEEGPAELWHFLVNQSVAGDESVPMDESA